MCKIEQNIQEKIKTFETLIKCNYGDFKDVAEYMNAYANKQALPGMETCLTRLKNIVDDIKRLNREKSLLTEIMESGKCE